MPIRWPIILLFIFSACNPKPAKQTTPSTNPDTAKNNIDTLHKEVAVLVRDTFLLNGQRVVRLQVNDKFNCLVSLKGDIIIAPTIYYFSAAFTDIDEDGYKDIRVFGFSNTPNQCDTWLYNKTDSSYKRIENADLDFTKLPGTNYYYSYNRAGCGDLDWESHLLKIENWKETDIGLMNTMGCGDAQDGIELYKLILDRRILLKRLPLPKFNNNGRNNKWAYLKKYWANNYAKYE